MSFLFAPRFPPHTTWATTDFFLERHITRLTPFYFCPGPILWNSLMYFVDNSPPPLPLRRLPTAASFFRSAFQGKFGKARDANFPILFYILLSPSKPFFYPQTPKVCQLARSTSSGSSCSLCLFSPDLAYNLKGPVSCAFLHPFPARAFERIEHFSDLSVSSAF